MKETEHSRWAAQMRILRCWSSVMDTVMFFMGTGWEKGVF
jgi:hypothetical protein